MSRGEEGPERTQRTVAELLAKYGANSEENTPRRRRRRADDVEETTPQAIIDRVLSDSGNMPRIRGDEEPPPTRAEHRHGASRSNLKPPAGPPQAAGPAAAPTRRQMPPVPPPGQAEPPRPATRGGQPSQPLPRPNPAPRPGTGEYPAPQPSGQYPAPPQPQPSGQFPAPPQPQPSGQFPAPQPSGQYPAPPQPSGQWPTPQPPQPEPGGLAARLEGRQQEAPPPADVTEQLPRIPDEPAPPVGQQTGQHPAPPRARVARPPQPSQPMPVPVPAYPQHEPDEPEYPTEYHGFSPVEDPALVGDRELADDFEDEYDAGQPGSVAHERPIGEDDDFADDEADADESGEERSPLKEWLVMAGQMALGVVGGAGLWLGFNYLWGMIPAAALVAAVVVIVGLVWVVRKARHADDLQTTIITVFIGLFVTVSPAAMLLLKR